MEVRHDKDDMLDDMLDVMLYDTKVDAMNMESMLWRVSKKHFFSRGRSVAWAASHEACMQAACSCRAVSCTAVPAQENGAWRR